MTILFSLCWLGEPWRIERNLNWLKFNLEIKDKLGFDKIIFVDNSSNIEDLKLLNGNIYSSNKELLHKAENNEFDIYRFEEFLPRTGIWEYPYCWRGLSYLKNIIKDNNVKKVIFLDTDFYILTSKLANHVKNLNKGWESFFCNKYKFPEAAIHILCEDNIDKLLNFPIPSSIYYNNQHMEWLLPFTKINKNEFVGDRYGEGLLPQKIEMDYYGQWQPGVNLKFDLTINK